MRTILIAVIAAAGIGLMGTSALLAAPAGGVGINAALPELSPVQEVKTCTRWRCRGRRCFRRCWY